MAANLRHRSMLQAELSGRLPRERPAQWPGGTHWDALWDCLDAHINSGVSAVYLAHHHDVPEGRMRGWLQQASILARKLVTA